MASSLLALLDDITTLLDDVSLMTKVAAKKTAGVLGDDLALNAQQITGVNADRELPVVWAVAKGSLLNKAILVPAALAISAFVPAAVTPLLMVGGAFLCFEGVEKLAHRYLAHGDADDEAHAEQLHRAAADGSVDLVALERDKIKGAVRTDFILSAEIIAIALGTMAEAPIATQAAVLTAVAVTMTVFVYGLVGAIVKLDDLGLALLRRGGAARPIGQAILRAAPWLMKALSVAGTVAMFLVGGGIIAHGLPALHHAVDTFAATQAPVIAALVPSLVQIAVGLVVGTVTLVLWQGVQRLRRRTA